MSISASTACVAYERRLTGSFHGDDATELGDASMTRKDDYYNRAKQQGYRSRAAYKLKQLDEDAGLISEGDTVVDLGAAPGGWLQVANELAGEGGTVVGVDLQRIKPIDGVETIRGDMTEADTRARIVESGGDAFRHEPSLVPADDGVAVEPEEPFGRLVDPGHLEVLVEEERADLGAVEHVLQQRRVGGRPIPGGRRPAARGTGRRTPPHAPVRTDLLGFEPVPFDEAFQTLVRTAAPEVEALRHLRRRPWSPGFVEEDEGLP